MPAFPRRHRRSRQAGARRPSVRRDADSLCVAAQSAVERRPEKPSATARRHSARANRSCAARCADPRLGTHGRHAAERARKDAPPAAPHPRDDAGVALYPADVRIRKAHARDGQDRHSVDEIHAVAGNKRGAHLALSLERLGALCGEPPTRVGISATTKPIARIAEYLTGNPDIPCMIIDAGTCATGTSSSICRNRRSRRSWRTRSGPRFYDRLAELIREHRTTLVFVNTRRLAERAARHLAERLGEDAVTSHHGSLAKEHRLRAEQRLKQGDIKAIVATSSLELGIDIVTSISSASSARRARSPRCCNVSAARVTGRRHCRRGRLFPLSCDELVECAALLASVGRRELDAIRLCRGALDVLTQQIVAEVSMREWRVDELLALVRKAAPYRDIEPGAFTALVRMLAEGFSTQRGRRGAHLFFRPRERHAQGASRRPV